MDERERFISFLVIAVIITFFAAFVVIFLSVDFGPKSRPAVHCDFVAGDTVKIKGFNQVYKIDEIKYCERAWIYGENLVKTWIDVKVLERMVR